MGYAQASARMTTAEFTAWEDTQAEKHQSLAGEAHARLSACRACIADRMLGVRAAQAVFHPDVLVTWQPEGLGADTVMRQLNGHGVAALADVFEDVDSSDA
ncbi:MAG: hypothetical protein ACK4TK_11395 [Thiobacillaceae bacterium]